MWGCLASGGPCVAWAGCAVGVAHRTRGGSRRRLPQGSPFVGFRDCPITAEPTLDLIVPAVVTPTCTQRTPTCPCILTETHATIQAQSHHLLLFQGHQDIFLVSTSDVWDIALSQCPPSPTHPPPSSFRQWVSVLLEGTVGMPTLLADEHRVVNRLLGCCEQRQRGDTCR